MPFHNTAAVAGDFDDSDVVAGDASYVSSSSLLLSAISHNASVWAPMIWCGTLPPGTACDYKLRCRISTYTYWFVFRLFVCELHFFFGRPIWRPFPYYSFYWCAFYPLTPRPAN